MTQQDRLDVIKHLSTTQMITDCRKCFEGDIWHIDHFKSFRAWVAWYFGVEKLGGRPFYIHFFVAEFQPILSKLLTRPTPTLDKTNVINFLDTNGIGTWLKLPSTLSIYSFLKRNGNLPTPRVLLIEIVAKDKIVFDNDFSEGQYLKELQKIWNEFEKSGDDIQQVDRYDLLAQFWKRIYCRNGVLIQEEDVQEEDVNNVTDPRPLLKKLKKLTTKREELQKAVIEYQEKEQKIFTQLMRLA